MSGVLLPPTDEEHEVRNIRGLLLAASLSPQAIALLLGGVDLDTAAAYKERAIGRFCGIKHRIEQAKRP